VSNEDKLTLIEGDKTWKREGTTVVFHERDRVLLNVTDRWHKGKIQAFVEDVHRTDFNGLYYKLKTVLKQYVELQKDAQYGLLAAWIIATYFHRFFMLSRSSLFMAKNRQVKQDFWTCSNGFVSMLSKLKVYPLQVLLTLLMVSGDISHDQAEALSSPKMEEILGILADSYTVGEVNAVLLTYRTDGGESLNLKPIAESLCKH